MLLILTELYENVVTVGGLRIIICKGGNALLLRKSKGTFRFSGREF